MDDRKDHEDSNVGTVDDARPAGEEGGAPGPGRGSESVRSGTGSATGPAADAAEGAVAQPVGEAPGRAPGDAASPADEEVDILRSELSRVQEQLEEAKREADDLRDRYLRSRAELDNYRRRAAGDVERAREAGLDSAVLAVLAVFDDLGRALQAADTTDDPSTIVPGVRAVKEALERSLENLDIRPIGAPGEPFDPHQHEALTAVPPTGEAQPGTIADVFQAGFRRGDRLVRPARVVVYKEPDEA